MKRKLGHNGVEVTALGMGCWAIGGPHARGGNPVGWGQVNDDESIAALQRAFDLGVDFYDTADVYGCGHSEIILARAGRQARPNRDRHQSRLHLRRSHARGARRK